ncbi:MAG: prepilin-type N-terminal cleavage/methylation domain-containing protein [Desulfobacteraceae bacterium]|jgi:prepilin-type N-terminal cleavage/methylation domain-containing protein|nr:prepilin-type N-terminal cleavage/methylation domain-containing protein [Desulfobacteraceae bacterium]
MLQKLRSNKEGFTLIELMIVIAIIGILAAIAIPNFISYRNKAYCSAAENDAHAIAAALADYFAVPSHTDVPSIDDLNITLSGQNSLVTALETFDSNSISIQIEDGSGSCPDDYQSSQDQWANNVFTLNME